MLASDVAIGQRVRSPVGTEVVILFAWATCMGVWRAFIGEDERGQRHFFEVHRIRSLASPPGSGDNGSNEEEPTS